MGKGFLFFAFSCCILVLSIINLSIGPVVNKVVSEIDDEDKKNQIQSAIDACERVKGMHDMEYTSFIFDIVIGFVCGLLGLFHLFELKKEFVPKTGLIGFICGIVGFALSFVYVIFNGLVFTSKYSDVVERESDGYFAERKGSSGTIYNCIASYDKEDVFSGFAKFSDLNKKQYNYKKDFYGDDFDSDCICDDISKRCTKGESFDAATHSATYGCHSSVADGTCKYIYYRAEEENIYKDIFDRFLTTLILSLVVCLANIGLALFGFLLFRTPGDF